MGADAQIMLAQQPKPAGYALFRKVEHIIAQVEQSFSLHLDSELDAAQCNRLVAPPLAGDDQSHCTQRTCT